DVKGIPVSHLLDRAGALSGVNALTFVSSDGCEVALPLSWVVAHHGVISYEINGEDLSASVGGNNQLWLAGAPANYFVRDICEVRVEARDEAPADPVEGAEFPNSPNAGVTSAR
ncbi:MAG: molybdopterin-dependent oxidoreductase, partial [Coriobacteriia bacterium]|nr:molybdopterin-dependent oxidoreductase [Coriobacteriia bacterium]